MSAPLDFVPKQCMPFDEALFKIIGADETLSIAKYEMTLLPMFPADSIIHDAACGLGAVTEALLRTSPPDTIKIKATDIAPPMTQIYNQIAESSGWPAKAIAMDAQNLTFPNNYFTHTFLSFGLPIIKDPVLAAKEIYRTIKPGGTAVTAFWLQIPQGESAGETRRAVWGPKAKLATEPKPEHTDPNFLRSLLVKGGFEYEDVELYQEEAYLLVKDIHEFATAIWSAIGMPPGGWLKEDEDLWDTAVAKYKEILQDKEGFSRDEDGKITLTAIAQVAIVKKTVKTC